MSEARWLWELSRAVVAGATRARELGRSVGGSSRSRAGLGARLSERGLVLTQHWGAGLVDVGGWSHAREGAGRAGAVLGERS
jgi:hypothetical protein